MDGHYSYILFDDACVCFCASLKDKRSVQLTWRCPFFFCQYWKGNSVSVYLIIVLGKYVNHFHFISYFLICQRKCLSSSLVRRWQTEAKGKWFCSFGCCVGHNAKNWRTKRVRKKKILFSRVIPWINNQLIKHVFILNEEISPNRTHTIISTFVD